MRKVISRYIELMNKYILVKVLTILIVLFIITQLLTILTNKLNYEVTDDAPVSEYNRYTTQNITTEGIAQHYFSDFKLLIYYDIEEAFSLLEADYKANFGSVEDFKDMVNEIDVQNMEIKDYAMINTDEDKKYVIMDNNDNVYNFIVKSANEYTVFIEKNVWQT